MAIGTTLANAISHIDITAGPGNSYAYRVFAFNASGDSIPSNVASPPANSVTLTPSLTSPQAPGTPVTWTAVASGGSGTYQYRFWLYDGTSWSLVQDYGVGSTWSLPASTPVGNYTIAVDVRTSTAVYRDAVNYLAYQISP